ncbi:MAG TPA: Gp49 family protein [Burkholderiaceae bacterium]
MIKPTVGRKVWYRPSVDGMDAAIAINGTDPVDATIVAVHSDRLVNLAIFDAHGEPHQRRSVTLLQDDDACSTNGRYVEWMPYQVGQAKKDESAPAATPAASDAAIEQEIQAKGLTAPRVTPADIDAAIASEHYFTAQNGVVGASFSSGAGVSDGTNNPLNLLTFCVLVLRNGFTVTGESACISRQNFDAEIGQKVARQNAVQKIWPLEGYRLKCELHRHVEYHLSQLATSTK